MTETTAHATTDDQLADIHALLNLTYPEIAARPSGWSAVLAYARILLARLDNQPTGEPAAVGTGRRAVLKDILEHWDTHVTDEVDDNPERNPHFGFVPAEKSGLVDALMEWRGGNLNDYVDPFAVHTVTVEYVAGWSEHSTIPKTTVRHPVDCDRLSYGELCAFDKVSDCGESLCLPEQCAPGEYEALIRRTDNMLGAGEEYIEIGQPVVRES